MLEITGEPGAYALCPKSSRPPTVKKSVVDSMKGGSRQPLSSQNPSRQQGKLARQNANFSNFWRRNLILKLATCSESIFFVLLDYDASSHLMRISKMGCIDMNTDSTF
jgi:hypothetical protein